MHDDASQSNSKINCQFSVWNSMGMRMPGFWAGPESLAWRGADVGSGAGAWARGAWARAIGCGLTADGERARVWTGLSACVGAGAGRADRRRRAARGRITTSANTAHQTAWRVAALTRGINRSESQTTPATPNANHNVFSTAISPTAEKALRDARIALIFHPPRGDCESSGLPVERDRRRRADGGQATQVNCRKSRGLADAGHCGWPACGQRQRDRQRRGLPEAWCA